MTPTDHNHLMSLLADAMERDPSEQREFLDDACAGDSRLRTEVEALLACADRASIAFDAAAEHIAQPDPDRIGPYHLLEPLGEGGMAIVYKAQQEHPVRRIVAVKLIKLGMDTRQFVARFEAERQVLAMMDHPGIARIYDAGATELGRPFFAMEYVSGRPLLEYCDEQGLGIRQRLELFKVVCLAVEHAHRKGVIHRDLKSSNVLVTRSDGGAMPKVIDFGVAKAIDAPLSDRVLQTEQGQLIGTPEYMSPEQAEHGAAGVDTRSDVYSLGVLLYELVAGVGPLASETLRSAGYERVRKVLLEAEVPRPATRLRELPALEADRVARSRVETLPTLLRALRGELEWIPLKAMRRDREQRYRGAAELADDIDNYLAGRPLIAGPESTRYRLRKFVGRNRAAVAVSAAMALLLVLGIVATSWQAIRATRAERTALAEKREAEEAKEATSQVNAFLVDMFRSVDPKVAQGREMRVKDVLDGAARTLPTKFAAQPRVESAISSALGRTYMALGLYEQSEAHLSKALEIDLRVLGEDDPQTITSRQHFGLVRRHRGDYEQARAIYQDTLERRRRVQGSRHIETLASLSDLAVILDLLGAPEAEATYREARDGMIEVAGKTNPRTLLITGNLGQLLQRVGRYEESERLLRECYEERLRALGPDDPDTIGTSTQLAYVMSRTGKLDDSESLMREAVERSRRVMGENHARTIFAANGLAQVLCNRDKLAEGVELYRRVVAQAREHLGPDNPNTPAIMQAAATEMTTAGQDVEAEALLRESLAALVRLRGPNHPLTITSEMNLSSLLQKQERWAEALPLARAGFERLCEPGRVQIQPSRRARYLTAYGICLAKLGHRAEAYEPLVVAREAFRQTGDEDRVSSSRVLKLLAEVSDALGHPEDAARWRAELTALTASTQPATHPAPLPASAPG